MDLEKAYKIHFVISDSLKTGVYLIFDVFIETVDG